MLSLTYNAKAGAYALDGTGKFADSNVVGAGFTYDPATGIASICTARSCAPAQEQNGHTG